MIDDCLSWFIIYYLLRFQFRYASDIPISLYPYIPISLYPYIPILFTEVLGSPSIFKKIEYQGHYGVLVSKKDFGTSIDSFKIEDAQNLALRWTFTAKNMWKNGRIKVEGRYENFEYLTLFKDIEHSIM